MNDVWKADHTTGKISPTLFDQYCGLFYIPSDLTHERIKISQYNKISRHISLYLMLPGTKNFCPALYI